MSSVLFGNRILGGLAAVLCAAAITGCSRGNAEPVAATPLPEVLVAPARAADKVYDLNLPARAFAGESAQLYARATGLVAERRVDMGDSVSAGQVLAVIAAPEVDSAVREAQAEVHRARADEDLARTNFQRAEVLIQSNAISREMHSDRKAAHDAARADRAAAEARLASAREHQGFQYVRAPFAGVIASRSIDRGDRVVGDSAATASPLFTINALDTLRVVVDVPQSAALQVRRGLQAQVAFPELPGERFTAQVVRTAQSISTSAGTMQVELRLSNPDHRIPAGMAGEVRLSVPRVVPAVVIPESAIMVGADGPRVAVLDAEARLGFRPVKLGRTLGNEVEVVEGLAPGVQVVMAPNALLAPNMRVQAKFAPQAKGS